MLEFKQVTTADANIIKTMVNWYNDEAIQHFIRPNFEAGSYEVYSTEEMIKSICDLNKYYYIAYDDDLPIGEVSITVNPRHLARKGQNTSWISILIGEANYRGKGYGTKMMSFVESKSLELGLDRIELGVFEFNENAINFYNKLGYTPFHEFKNFTFWAGSWYSDIRMEKYL